MLEELFSKPIVVFGCGNTLLGDDGFGPVCVEYFLSRYQLPGAVSAVVKSSGFSFRQSPSVNSICENGAVGRYQGSQPGVQVKSIPEAVLPGPLRVSTTGNPKSL